MCIKFSNLKMFCKKFLFFKSDIIIEVHRASNPKNGKHCHKKCLIKFH